MRYLLILTFLSLAFTAHAQKINFGHENVQISVLQLNNEKMVHLEGVYNKNLFSIFSARFSLGVGFTDLEDDLTLNLQPSAMAGIKIPIDGVTSIGVYSGYLSNINKNISHRFIPISASLQFGFPN